MEPDCPICRTGLIGSASVCTCAWWTLLVARLPELYCFGPLVGPDAKSDSTGCRNGPRRSGARLVNDARFGDGARYLGWWPDSALEPDCPIQHSPIQPDSLSRTQKAHPDRHGGQDTLELVRSGQTTEKGGLRSPSTGQSAGGRHRAKRPRRPPSEEDVPSNLTEFV